jgi:peptide/nickel transport system substrate-binding protein
MRRRSLLAAAPAALAAGTILRPRPARAAQPLPVVLESEVVIFDPHATTAAITRTFGLHVFDMLFAMDNSGAIQPQMVESTEQSKNLLAWTFHLRDGLRWHDGKPVTAAECVLSLQRWAPRDPLGRMLLAATDKMTALDARSFMIALKQPFPMMLQVLGKPNAPLPVMMPERLAAISVDTRIKDPVGSGPFRFRPDLYRPGSSMILERFDGYVPRREKPDFLAGGKTVHLDQIDWRVVPDQTIGANALMQGEIAYMQYLPFDMLPLLQKAHGIKLLGLGGVQQFQGNFRLNHAAPPFDDPAVRRVLWKLVDQNAILTAIGVPPEFRAKQCGSFFLCDAPLSSDAGASAAKLDIEGARADLKATSYNGQKVVMMEVGGSISQTACQILAQNMREAGFTVDEQVMDWGTVLARRAKRDGWSLFGVYSNGTDMASPLTHFYIASTCADYPGWSCDAKMPGLIAGFAKADGPAAQKSIAAEIQQDAYDLTPSVMWGQFTIPAGYSDRLRNLIPSAYPMFWEVEASAA